MPEDEYLKYLRDYLEHVVEFRIEVVSHWLEINVKRFEKQPAIATLRREYDRCAKELRRGVVICGYKCESCYLTCVQHKEHEGGHSCQTSHKCPVDCEFNEKHTSSRNPPCGVP